AGIIGIILIVIGIVAFAYGGITYTKREKVLDLGPIQATAEKQKTIPFPPVLGGVCLVGGIVLVVFGSPEASLADAKPVATGLWPVHSCAVSGKPKTARRTVGPVFSPLPSTPRKSCCLCGQDREARPVSDPPCSAHRGMIARSSQACRPPR